MARSARKNSDIETWKIDKIDGLNFEKTKFVGYEKLEEKAKLLGKVPAGSEEAALFLVFDKTPFYAQGGGQIGDSGFLTNETIKAEVLTTFKVNHLFVHRCQIINGEINIGDSVHAAIDIAKREEIRAHHTSAPLL